jgi:hypothetical protein
VREVREETGVWARIKENMKSVSFTVNGEPIKVTFYLMEAVGKGKPSDEGRKHGWMALERALAQVSHKESQELLMLAEHKLTAI